MVENEGFITNTNLHQDGAERNSKTGYSKYTKHSRVKAKQCGRHAGEQNAKQRGRNAEQHGEHAMTRMQNNVMGTQQMSGGIQENRMQAV